MKSNKNKSLLGDALSYPKPRYQGSDSDLSKLKPRYQDSDSDLRKLEPRYSDLAHKQDLSNIIMISDPEGSDILSFIPDNKIDPSTDYYVLGDIFDSTGSWDPTNEDFVKYKSYNIRNILTCLNSNVNLIFGNRDLTKLRFYLFTLTSNNDDKYLNRSIEYETWEKTSNKGDLLFNHLIYKNCSNHLYDYLGKRNPLDIESTYKEDSYIKLLTKITANMGSCPGIFKDCNFIKNIFREIKLEYSNDMEYNSYIILLLFKIMFMTNKNIDLNTFLLNYQTISNLDIFKGILYKLYTRKQSYIMKTFEINNAIVLLSHGGITKYCYKYFKSFLNCIKTMLTSDPRTLSNLNPQLNSDNFFILPQKDQPKIKNNYLTPTTTTTPFQTVIHNNNRAFKIILNNLLNYANKQSCEKFPVEYVQINYILSETNDAFNKILYETITNMNDIKKELAAKHEMEGIIPNNIFSPIGPGIVNMFKHKMESLDNVSSHIIQILGHKPFGIVSSAYIRDKNIVISLDISNTFIGTNLNYFDTKQIPKNYLNIFKDKDKDKNKNKNKDKDLDIDIVLNSNINMQIFETSKGLQCDNMFVVKYDSTSKLSDPTNQIILSKIDNLNLCKVCINTPSILNIDVNHKLPQILKYYIKIFNKYPLLYYGTCKISIICKCNILICKCTEDTEDNKTFHLLFHAMEGRPFLKNIYLLNDHDYNNFTTKYSDLYHNKYYKYKQKYLNLKYK
jgi:hypothetical protein